MCFQTHTQNKQNPKTKPKTKQGEKREKIGGFLFPLLNLRCHYNSTGKIFPDGGVVFKLIRSVSPGRGCEAGTLRAR